MKIRIITIIVEEGNKLISYILDLTREDVKDKEILMCINEQLFRRWKK